ALNFAPGGKPGTITVDLTRNQVRLAPEYKRGEPVVVVSSAFPGQSTPEPEREPCPAHRHAISANPSERRTTKRRRLRKGPCRGGPPITASPRSQRGLDWFAFCVADVQTGFGPFVSVYLTAQGWTQVDIGLVLTARGLVALALQMPGGAIVDAARSERAVAALAMIAVIASA